MPESLIVQYTRQVMSDCFPFLLEDGHGLNHFGVGGLSHRGRYHPLGLSADIFFQADDDLERQAGDRIFAMYRREYRALGRDHVIWNRRIWSQRRPTVRDYEGRHPHTNHVHITYSDEMANERPSVLMDRARQISIDLGISALA